MHIRYDLLFLDYNILSLGSIFLVTEPASKNYSSILFLYLYYTGGLCLLAYILITIFNFGSRIQLIKSATELESKEEYIRLLLNSVGHPIFGVNLSGKCIFNNQSCALLMGYDSNKDLSTTHLNIHFTDLNGTKIDMLERLLFEIKKNKNVHCESHFIIDNLGNKVPVEIRAYPNIKSNKIIGAVVTLQDISERKCQEEQIRYLAYHDALTGLPNRRLLIDHFEQLVKETGGNEVFLLYLDLDHFKTINDTLGHSAGDSILKVVALRLLSFKPRCYNISRLGGDEYLILVNCKNNEQLKILLSEIIIEIQKPIQLSSQQIITTPSIGVAQYSLHGRDFESLLKAADMALYKAKEDGRNTYRFYHNKMGRQELRQLMLQTDLRLALIKKQLFIHYQPQINIKNKIIIGVEALLRWLHPNEGLISPTEFIPAAESNGMIIPISNWLLGEVCKQAMQWKKNGIINLVIAVNCSAVQFQQKDFVSTVRDVLQSSGLPPHELELELTESMLIQDSERVIKIISELKALGIKLSIDDFGTGYSNMAYLKRFAFDKLKIDRSFIKTLANSENDQAIVQAIITLAHNFNLKAIAEGVEDCSTANLLSKYGCDEIQGYLFSKPLCEKHFLAWLGAQQIDKPTIEITSSR